MCFIHNISNSQSNPTKKYSSPIFRWGNVGSWWWGRSRPIRGWALTWTQLWRQVPALYFVTIGKSRGFSVFQMGQGTYEAKDPHWIFLPWNWNIYRWNDTIAGIHFKMIGRDGWGFRWIRVGVELIIVKAERGINRNSLYHSLSVIFKKYVLHNKKVLEAFG